MLAVIWQDLRAEMENSVLLFESAKQMSLHIQSEHSLTSDERRQIEQDKYAVICPDDEGKDKLISSEDEVHYTEYPRGSVSYSLVSCEDHREWDVP